MLLSIFILKCLSLNLLLVVATFQTDSFCKLTLESQLAHGIRSPLYFGYISKPNHYTYSVFMQSLTATHGYSTVQTQLVLQCSKSGSAKLLWLTLETTSSKISRSHESLNFDRALPSEDWYILLTSYFVFFAYFCSFPFLQS